jgi:hypothetical protein
MKTTIEMACEADCTYVDLMGDNAKSVERLKRFEALVRADEREIDAKVCEEVERKSTKQPPMVGLGCQACAAAIRARGN